MECPTKIVEYVAKANFDGNRTVLQRRKFILDYMFQVTKKSFKPPANLIDIGIGSGYFLELCTQAGYVCAGADLSNEIINTLKERFQQKNIIVDLKQCSADKLDYSDNTFDIVTCFDCLEHLPENVFLNALIDIRRILRKNGAFFGTFPTNENLEERMTVCPKCAYKFHPVGHMQSLSVEKMHKALSPYFTNIIFHPGPIYPNFSRIKEYLIKFGTKIIGLGERKSFWTYFIAHNP